MYTIYTVQGVNLLVNWTRFVRWLFQPDGSHSVRWAMMPVPIAAARPVSAVAGELSRGYQQTNNGGKQGHGLDQGGNDQHGGLNPAGRFGLTGNPFHSTTTNPTDT